LALLPFCPGYFMIYSGLREENSNDGAIGGDGTIPSKEPQGRFNA
jgi:hypothetical protein